MDSHLCEAIKHDGLQCTRTYKHTTLKGKHVCKQHLNAQTTVKDKKEPWDLKALPAPNVENGKRTIQKIRTKLLKGPKTNDAGGAIYIYYLSAEQKLTYWKIGKTRRNVDERLQEWAEEHKQEVVAYETFVVTKNLDFIEALIHVYLAYCNMHRYPHGKGFHSVLSLHNKVIKDGQEQQPGDTERLVAKNKHVEWFNERIDVIMKVVTPILEAYAGGFTS